ncbi:alpha/beta fold hydrolase [Kitasatospora viridis]|uniref:Pimeloyl-ACP methyl ester carboxylesterase n=1 Tax=Kitasatospora viridis TaxID=281105 RepID=A0A561UJ11_9ACTN|nr:alpha/beta hydrolase [Kitasatospora viridis]TWF99329.1 pimeloyl-ACP methyl ester carboxylesterase [Kitasatospora viridis]
MTISHRLVGAGEHKVIVLHDWFGTTSGWGPFLDYLDRSAFSYAMLDYRGYGDRVAEPGEFTLAEIAQDALALADQLGWDTFSLVGHSMGGKAAQRVLAEAPHRVRKLVGVAPVPAGVYEMDEQGWQLFRAAPQNFTARRMIIDLVTGQRAKAVWLDRMVARSSATSRVDACAAYFEDWAGQDVSAGVAGLELPVKVFTGEHDLALTAELMRRTWLELFPNAELTELANSGHYPMYEVPVHFAKELEDFLAA